jgi:hypothetical protein
MFQPRQVYSSHLASIGYDSDTSSMVVTYKNGKTSIYQDVPAEVFDTVAKSPSIGEAIHKYVRGKYAHGYAK